jgi:F-type H+-transporting ATPase subunit b
MFGNLGNLMAAAASESGGIVETFETTFGLDAPVLVAQMINFILVAAALYYFAIRPVLRTIADRQKKISDGLQYAEEMKSKLADAEKQHSEKLKEASQEAQRILEEAKRSAKELSENQRREAVAQAEGIIEKAREASQAEREQMLAEVRQEVARLVVETTAKVLERELTTEQRAQFSQSAAQEIAGRN